MSRTADDIAVYSIPEQETSSILDIAAVTVEVAAAAQRAEEFNYPVLAVWGTQGWPATADVHLATWIAVC